MVHTTMPQSKSRCSSKRAFDVVLKDGYKRPRGGKNRHRYYPERDWKTAIWTKDGLKNVGLVSGVAPM